MQYYIELITGKPDLYKKEYATKEEIDKVIAERKEEFGTWEENVDYLLLVGEDIFDTKLLDKCHDAIDNVNKENEKKQKSKKSATYKYQEISDKVAVALTETGKYQDLMNHVRRREEEFGEWVKHVDYTLTKFNEEEEKRFAEMEKLQRKLKEQQDYMKKLEALVAAGVDFEEAERQLRKSKSVLINTNANTTKIIGRKRDKRLVSTDDTIEKPKTKKKKLEVDLASLILKDEDIKLPTESRQIQMQLTTATETKKIDYGQVELIGGRPKTKFPLNEDQMKLYRNRECVLPMSNRYCGRPATLPFDEAKPFCPTHWNNPWSKYKLALDNNYMNIAGSATSASKEHTERIKSANMILMKMLKEWKANAYPKKKDAVPVKIKSNIRQHLIAKLLIDNKVQLSEVHLTLEQYKEVVPKALFATSYEEFKKSLSSSSMSTSDIEGSCDEVDEVSGDSAKSENSEYDLEKAPEDKYEEDSFVSADEETQPKESFGKRLRKFISK